MKCVTAALAAIVLCCTAASARATEAPACRAGHESALADGRGTLRPGATLCIRLRASGRQVQAQAEAVESGVDIAGALVAELSEQGGSTMLSLQNPLGGTLRYRARRQPGLRGTAFQARSTTTSLTCITGCRSV